MRQPIQDKPPEKVRVRAITGPYAPENIINFGEIGAAHIPASKWHGWPNGSCVNRRNGFHLGRSWPHNGFEYVLRFNPVTRKYIYVGRFANYSEAWNALVG